MKKYAYIAALLLLVSIITYFLMSSDEPATTDGSSYITVGVLDTTYKEVFKEVEEEQAVLLDVRTPEEYSQKHAVGAVLFEVTRLDNGELPRYPADTKLYVYCRSGSRSARAVDTLKKAGFTDVIDLGALSSWEAAGGATQSS